MSQSATMAAGMPQSNFPGASPNSHFLVGEMPAPAQLERQWWQGTGASIVIHGLVLGLLLFVALHTKQVAQVVQQTHEKFNVIFLDQPGPGGGGGGSPLKTPEPPRQAKIVAVKPPEPKVPVPVPKPADVPVPDLNIPIKTPDATQMLAGALSNGANGIGIPGGGTGGGIGSGTGNGVGPGTGGGYGGGAFEIGNGITSPDPIFEPKPNYTADAMRAKIQGEVDVNAVVLPNGTVDPASLKITRSLDASFGLDEEAKKAVRQWRFRAGVCNRREGCGSIPFGQPVPVLVQIQLTFTLR